MMTRSKVPAVTAAVGQAHRDTRAFLRTPVVLDAISVMGQVLGEHYTQC